MKVQSSRHPQLFLKFYLPVLIWVALIFSLSSLHTLPSANTSVFDFFIKKSLHIAEYAVLSWLVIRASHASLQSKKSHGYVWVVALLLCLLYAISDELHQSFVPGRTATLQDVGYDFLGSAIAMLRYYKYV